MKYSVLFPKTLKEAPKDEVATNAKLLIRGGFVEKLGAGIYDYLPLGWRVHKKIEQIIREEMDAIGGQELNLAALHPKERWEKTGRWASFDALFKVGNEFALGATHEEILTPIVGGYVSSYRELPIYLYQIQVKFRQEARAKSGLLRCREFIMKDLYSFHATEEDRADYYEKVRGAYQKIFQRVGLSAIYTEASGGAFSKTSHEFQVLTNSGEDIVVYCDGKGCGYAQNKEIAIQKAGDKCVKCEKFHHDETVKEGKAIEVGNIFPLGTRFSEAFGAYFLDKNGERKPMIMGSYGIGLGRLMGTIVEVFHDDKGIIWPKSVAPYDVHLISIPNEKSATTEAQKVYETLNNDTIDVLYDDRENVSAGEKFADCDLLGIPVRLVVSKKTGDKIEWKERDKEKTELLSRDEVLQRLKAETAATG